MAVSPAVSQAILGQRAPDIGGAFREGQEIALQRQERARQDKIRELSGMAAQGEEGARGELAGLAPEVALRLREVTGAQDDAALDRLFRDAQVGLGMLTEGNAQQFISFADQRIAAISRMGGNTQLTQGVRDLVAAGKIDEAISQLSGLTTSLDQAKQQGPTAAQRDREALLGGFSEEEQIQARRIEAGLAPRATGSAAQTIAAAGTAEQVGESQAIIREREKFADLTGASRAKQIDKGFDRIEKINTGINTIDRAIQAVRDGASTGALARRFPSIRQAAVELEQIGNQLALDVIGGVTLGAISEAELDLAKQVALPTGLTGDNLIRHLEERKAAQDKLRTYYQEQIQHLDQGGTVASFLRRKEGEQQAAPQAAPQQQVAPAQQAAPQRMRFDAQGNIL